MTQHSAVLTLAQSLIKIASVTPNDNGCQKILSDRLKTLGFTIIDFPQNGVSNFLASLGTGSPSFLFAGHTDVVPTGPLEAWNTPPFEPTVIDGVLYGRGAADMKGSLAAMVIAVEEFLKKTPIFTGSIHFLITSDEEGDAIDGTRYVVEQLEKQRKTFDYAIVGEPTAHAKVGDEIKIGRRGSLSATLKILGKQGHVAYPHLADNAIHRAASFLAKLNKLTFDPKTAKAKKIGKVFQKTSLQVSNISAGTGATNVIPGDCTLKLNFRYSPAVAATQLKRIVEQLLKKEKIKYDAIWNHGSEPFLSVRGKLAACCQTVIQKICKRKTDITTSGGTSDARFIRKICKELVEFGPCNATIHQINECVRVKDLEQLAACYAALLAMLNC